MAKNGTKVIISPNTQIGNVSKSTVNPYLFSYYNLIMRRLPLSITKEHILDTFYDFKINKVKMEKISDDEQIACINLPKEYAESLYQVLEGKVISIDNTWYPIEMIIVKDNLKIKRSSAVILDNTPQEEVKEKEEEEQVKEKKEEVKEEKEKEKEKPFFNKYVFILLLLYFIQLIFYAHIFL